MNILDRPFTMEEKLNQMLLYYDDLTGLPNRKFFRKRLINEIESHKDLNKKMGLIHLDIDRFKVVNDTLGHNLGDLLIAEVSLRLMSCAEEGDIVARMGGDEFTFIITNRENADEIIDVAEKIMSALNKSFHIGEAELFVTASLGIAVYPDDGTVDETLMKHADNAMYRAKAAGGNNYKVFDPHIYSRRREQFQLEIQLRKAIENDELFLQYQPQVDLRTGETIGVEALVRWLHPQLGVIYPDKFIPIAEETGFIVAIGDWVLKKACTQNKVWQERGLSPIRISVNLSSQQFLKDDLVNKVAKVLEETGLRAEYLELEITESMTMDAKRSDATIKDLQRLGVQISIDDFGTGYSSLNYLQHFSIQRLKIDKTFIRGMTLDHQGSRIVSAIIAMAHGLGLKVIAEGVENEDQIQMLVQQKCDEVQGYYYSKPVQPEAIAHMLSANKGVTV